MCKTGELVKLETKWAVDFDASAVSSWKINRPEVRVMLPALYIHAGA